MKRYTLHVTVVFYGDKRPLQWTLVNVRSLVSVHVYENVTIYIEKYLALNVTVYIFHLLYCGDDFILPP